ncbi:MAG: hypothetical protein RIB67_11445 [Miltoncostaeaceae bacterium]
MGKEPKEAGAKAPKGAKAAKGAAPADPTPEELAAAKMRLWVGRARAGGALLGFALGMWVCRRAGIPLVDATLRSLVGAAVLSLVAWWSTLLVIQALMRTAAAQRNQEIEVALAEAAASRADQIQRENEDVARRLRRHRGEPEAAAAAAESAEASS